MTEENLMNVVKEANKGVSKLRKEWKDDKDVRNHYKPFYERVKDQCENFEFFATICLTDIQFNFIGGEVSNPNKDTIIEISHILRKINNIK